MKSIILAAAAVFAIPAMAQTSGSTGTSSPTSNGGQGTAVTPAPSDSTMSSTPAPSTDNSMPEGSTMQTPMQQPMTTAGGDPVGGYQPSGSAMGGAMQPGARVVYQQAQTPDQAYPAPAPMAHYPMCKKGQFDNCMQGRASTHSREVRRRR